jgi:hypothetical protein
MNQHFNRLDKDIKRMNKASKTTDVLAHSISMMDQIKRISKLSFLC